MRSDYDPSAAGGKPVEIAPSKAAVCPSCASAAERKPASPADGAAAKYAAIFAETFAVSPGEAEGLKYQEFPAWDSAGQMTLVGRIEETFGVALDADDIYAFRSYADGREILEKKHGIKF